MVRESIGFAHTVQHLSLTEYLGLSFPNIGELQFHLRNSHCKLVILGGSHDNGYVRILNSITTEGFSTERISLLEGIPFGREYTGLTFKRLQFHNLFLTKHLDNYLHSVESQPVMTHELPQQRSHQPPPPYMNSTTMDSLLEVPTPSEHSLPIELPIISEVPPNEPGGTNPKVSTNPKLSARKLKQRQELPHPKKAILENIMSLFPPPCFDFYLPDHPNGLPTGLCFTESRLKLKCTYGHQYRFNATDFQALRFHAWRNFRCDLGPSCKNARCFLGHSCCKKKICTGRNCVFLPQEHRPGVYQPLPAENETVWVE